MTHLGQQLSALIDGELEVSERERVLVHISRCRSCQDEAAALRTLKRRMTSLGEACAGAGLTVRLMGLSSGPHQHTAESVWPAPPEPGWTAIGSPSRELRTGRYFLAGSLAVFLAGLGAAAVLAGGEPQAQAPPPPITPSIDVQLFSQQQNNGTAPEPAPGPAKFSSLRPRPASTP